MFYIFYYYWKIVKKIHTKEQKALNNQTIPEEQEQDRVGMGLLPPNI